MRVAEVRWVTQLEAKNLKLTRLVTDLSLDKAMLQDMLGHHCDAWAEA